jgi:zinc protease
MHSNDEIMNDDDRATLAAAASQATRVSGVEVRVGGAERLGRIGAARFHLENGLTLVIVQDDRAPVFAYQTWFKVGSRDEDPARTGLAHLLEHLMFKSTARHALGEFDREMERRGTQTNAATWVDWTFYQEALAARDDNLATLVEFEADRMQGLALDEETFASELEVVKNERRMAVEDSIGGRLNETLYSLAFTTHPYRWPTIGSMAHLEAATVGDLRRFYRTFYAPNNAIVVVVGALALEPTLTLLAQHYGKLPPQPIVRPLRQAEPLQEAARSTVIERPMLVPQVCVGFHAPPQLDRDFTAVQMLSEALVAGDNARLYRRLVTDDKLATDVEGAIMPFADPGLYEIMLTARAGVEPQRIIDVLQEELDRLPQGLSPAEFDKARNSLELSFFESWGSAWSIAEMMGHYEANYADFRLAFRGQERLAQVSPEDLRRVASEVFRATNRTTVVARAAEVSHG